MTDTCPCQRPGVKPTSAYTLGCRHPAARHAAVRYLKAYKAGLTRPGWIDGTGTRRRLQALAAAGWSAAALASRLGLTDNRVQQLRRGDNPTVEHHTEHRIRSLYTALRDTPGPSARTRSAAATRGWHPPPAWHDDDIDDPAAEPAHRPARTRPVIDPADVDHLRAFGVPDHEIAHRLGVQPDSLIRFDERQRAAARKAG